MAKVFTGRDGRLVMDGFRLAKVTSWSLESSVELLETTALNDNLRSFTPGVQAFSGSASLIYYKDDNGVTDASKLLNKLLRTGTDGVSTSDLVYLTLRVVDGRLVEGGTAREVAFYAYITSATIGVSVGEIVSAQIAFQVEGDLKVATF